MKRRLLKVLVVLVILAVGFAMICPSTSVAQVPTSLNFQGRLFNDAGAPLNNIPGAAADGRIDIRFWLYDAVTIGNPVGAPPWNALFADVEVINGLFSVELTGLTTNLLPPAAVVNRWLQVDVSADGGVNWDSLAPRKPLIASAYAIRAGEADTLDGHHWSEISGLIPPAPAEVDPQVGPNQNNYVPRWDAYVLNQGVTGALVKGAIWDPNNGRIGIGTENPGSTLSVAGNAAVGSSYAASPAPPPNGLIVEGRVGVGTPAPDFPLDVNGKTRLRGHVGIGRDPSDYALDVNGDSIIQNGSLRVAVDINADRNITAGQDITAGRDAGVVRGLIVGGQSKLTGNVGIGINPSDIRLRIAAPKDDGINIDTASWDVGGFARIFFREGGNDYFGGALGYDPDSDTLQLYTVEGGASKNGISVRRSDGNVGVGTLAPAAKLDVNGEAVVRGRILVTTEDYRIQAAIGGVIPPGGERAGFPFLALSASRLVPWGDKRTVIVPAKNTAPHIPPYTGGFEVTNPENNNTTLQTEEPDGNLLVRGSIKKPSDARLKLDQRELDYGVATVMSLHPKRYKLVKWTRNQETGEIEIHMGVILVENDIGFVAQEVWPFIPEAVDVPEDETVGTWNLSYEKIVVVLVKAVQEQQGQIDSQRQQIESQERRIAELERKMNALLPAQ